MPFPAVVDAWVVLKLVAVVALVLLNGFFVAAEFAIVKVRSTQLAAQASRGNRRAARAQHVTKHLDAYLSATQLGITLASLGLGWLGEPAVADLLVGPLHAVGVESEALVHGIAFTVAFGIITLLHIVVGELAPKSLAIQRAEGTTLRTAGPLHVFYVVFKPAIVLLNGLANWLLRLFGIRPASEHEKAHTEEELRMLLAESSTKKTLDRQRADILLRVFSLKNLEARNVMTPRPRVEWLDVTRPFDENLRRAEESGYTRFPLADGDPDKVVGMVHYRDLIRLARSASAQKDVSSVRRPVVVVPTTKPLEDLMTELLGRGLHMAIVIDEHGSTAGIVTLEDIFEEIFGEIRDEFDAPEGELPYRVVSEGHFIIEGHMPLHQAAALLRADLSSHDVTTVSGFVVDQLGKLPAKGERFRMGPYEARVREIERRRIQSIEVWRTPEPAEGEAAPE